MGRSGGVKVEFQPLDLPRGPDGDESFGGVVTMSTLWRRAPAVTVWTGCSGLNNLTRPFHGTP